MQLEKGLIHPFALLSSALKCKIFEFFKCHFVQVTVGQQSTTGTGPNKKLAKRAAAESLLQLLGYSRSVSSLLTPVLTIILSIIHFADQVYSQINQLSNLMKEKNKKKEKRFEFFFLTFSCWSVGV